MEFLVPWRLLLPEDIGRELAATDASDLKHIARVSGARIDVTRSLPVDASPGSVMVTLHGTMWQKRTAGRALVDWAFELQGVDRTNWWKFTRSLAIILPQAAYGTVTSEEVRHNVRVIGAQMSAEPPAEAAPAAAGRFLVHFEGNAQQVVSAVTRVNTAMQDLADHGRVSIADFSEAEGLAPPSVAEVVRSARLAPAAGVATQPPHTHPALAVPACGHPQAAAAGGFEAATHSEPTTPCTALKTCGVLAPEGALCQLSLLLPARAVRDALVPRGHLAEIAHTCGVQIDLAGGQIGGQTGLTLTGTVVANALATLHLQWRAAQCC